MTERRIDTGNDEWSRVSGALAVVTDATGIYTFSPDALPQVLTYDGLGNVATITAGPDERGNSFRQTMSYTTGKLTGISAWVKV